MDNLDHFFSSSSLAVLGLVSGCIGLVIALSQRPSSPESPIESSTKTATVLDIAFNKLQIWILQHPDQPLSRLLLPIVTFAESPFVSSPYLDSKRLAFGSNFCCAGQVVMGEFTAIETALTSPQARTWRLGSTVLDPNHGPNLDVGGRNVFLLSLSDKEAGGNSDHEDFRKCMQESLLNETALQRQQDEIAQRLVEELAADYLEMSHGTNGEFFTNDQRGLLRFMIRYLHYVIFGLDPDDEETVAVLTDLHYSRQSFLHYFAIISNLLQTLNLQGHRNVPDLVEKVSTIYENSPALRDFKDDENVMTRRELAKLMTSIMGIAALQGPLNLAGTALGHLPIPAYQGRQTAAIKPTHYWDELDLDNREAIRLYLLECARFRPPVNATHRVATAPFTLTIAGVERSFPAGTKILVPLVLGLLDEHFWGATTYEFNPQRENLCPFHIGFHSVGDRNAGRICPGRDIALNMLIDVVRTVGKARRG
jgi:cytochrome P450